MVRRSPGGDAAKFDSITSRWHCCSMPVKYTREILEEVAEKSRNVTDVMRNLGITNYGGGMARHISDRLRHFEINTSHFLGKSSRRGMVSCNRRSAEEILILRPTNQHRESAFRLRRALLEVGIEHKCAICSQGPEWNGMKLVLEIDHINGQRTDDRKENLRFLCPNCHSQVRITQR